MSGSTGPANRSPSRTSNSSPHQPAMVAVMVFALGICLDRWFPLSIGIWCALAMLCGMLSAITIFWRGPRAFTRIWPELGSISVLLFCLFAGASRHHVYWHMLSQNDISSWCTHEPHAVCLTGTIAQPIEIKEAKVGPRIPPWMEIDHSISSLQCHSLELDEQSIPVSGLVRMDIVGHLVHVRVGDEVKVYGQLSRPRPPENPGALDFGNYLKRQGMTAILRVNHPVAVQKADTDVQPTWWIARGRESLRQECIQIFFKHLNATQCGLASSLLIGDRTMLTDDLSDQFKQTGTMHLLAISGLHVGIFIGLLMAFCRLANLSSFWSALTMLGVVAAYAYLTDQNPPVLRAGLLAAIAIVGSLNGCRVDRMNALTVSALVLILWNPGDLFDIGAQLSFLAVGAILWQLTLFEGRTPPEEDLRSLVEQPWWMKQFDKAWQYVKNLYLMSLVVMLVTLPVTIAVFHLIAPIGLILNILLIPYIGLVLALGYLLMFGGLVLPFTAAWLAVPFSLSLSLLQQSVTWGQSFPLGHLYLSAISPWWLIGFYVLLAAAWRFFGTQRTSQLAFQALLCWCVLGLLLPFWPARREGVQATFLSVGHGLAVILEFPGGETMLYDAGTMGDGERATRAIAQALWDRGIWELDGVVVSHADHDHFSGLFGLFDQFPVHSLFINRNFLDFNQASVKQLCDVAASKNIPIQLIQTGDQFKLGRHGAGAVKMEVLYPSHQTSKRTDNANSIVLALTYAGREILFTGDLEKEGLLEVLDLPARDVDVLLSPHHGGKVANVLKLYDWANPRYAIVSSSNKILPSVAGIPETCTLLNTATSGAITIKINPDGVIHLNEFRKPQNNFADAK